MKEKKLIILASSSPRRKELLNRVSLDFKIDPSEINEDKYTADTPSELVKLLAKEKAKDVGRKYNNAIIIAADTIVICDDQVLGKPKNKKDAFDMLEKLSGSEHLVYTGIAFNIIEDKTIEIISDLDYSIVKMRNYNNKEINSYLNTGEYKDKAGSYAIQGYGSLLVEAIKGSYFTIMGFPVHKLAEILPEFNIDLYKKSKRT
ncbi:septum formation protein Maf [Halanaerobiaceae bacterium Z-7014]|uniref:dTTP/UTP pyrophosphatase n=1 Tax=Halonatronomonas betaini TaxID=2778430 RepID=A0A931F919_9FIRM|nr:Maf family protein [Halonatronomonas betaini]MBF8435959.1 septum formation protein Maf [Halonatronomonas betaini]